MFNENTEDLGLAVKHALVSINPADMVDGVAANLNQYHDASATPVFKPGCAPTMQA